MRITENMKNCTARALMTVVLLTAPVIMLWAQETNKKYALTTQMFLNELKEQAKQPVGTRRHTPARRFNGKLKSEQRLIASPDTVGGVVYIPCFIHLKDAGNLSAVRALGVEVEETFDGLDFVTARVPVKELEALADIDNVTKIKVARRMRLLTDEARKKTNVDDLLTQSPDALALGVKASTTVRGLYSVSSIRVSTSSTLPSRIKTVTAASNGHTSIKVRVAQNTQNQISVLSQPMTAQKTTVPTRHPLPEVPASL